MVSPRELTAPLDCRVALISGGSRGIGRGIAESLLRRGASVVIAARTGDEVARAAEELSELGPTRGVRCDATDAADVRDLVASAVSAFGRLDIAVCCQGIFEHVRFLECSEADWDSAMAVNLKGSFLVAQASAGAMIKCGTDAGRILFISSVCALAADPDAAPYNASKAGLHGLARGLAVDLGRYGITCNVIAPGWVATTASNDLPQAVLDGTEPFELSMTGRIGVPADIGEAAAWLLDPGSSYVTGSVVVIDGGQLAVAAMPSDYQPAEATRGEAHLKPGDASRRAC